MTSNEYDRARLDALTIAVSIIERKRAEVTTQNEPAWSKLYRAGEALKKQHGAEWKLYFQPEEEPTTVPTRDYFKPADFPTIPKWYLDPATIAVSADRTEAQRIACLISDHGINATVKTTPGRNHAVTVAQRDEARANRTLATAEQEATK